MLVVVCRRRGRNVSSDEFLFVAISSDSGSCIDRMRTYESRQKRNRNA